MTKEQAFCVVAEPASIETTVENGVSVGIWHPRQENGKKQPYDNMKPNRTGYPTTMKFANDKLIAIEKPSDGRKQFGRDGQRQCSALLFLDRWLRPSRLTPAISPITSDSV